ncbi:tetratricopeptide repeat protein [Mesorhizobium sp. CGMCC 1.15528]|uniref:Tetratricopeptide repeat protein n=1 Tax=Mesorhizobium zhangyense TaxID=1776730 RepID=A0A7C9R7L9_9HYPH|nr:winged helix-turn-helix domain-containing protein [Mesorhizobium zhangyense]NGN41796.1 tetratricopeptide repeat protein [Mesorhizobium zhangyense]
MLRFAGFELDQQRAELRGPDGEPIRLRPKPFAMLHLLATNAQRIVSKQELMEAVWPNIHVGEDSLFQCIREIRSALGDDQRQLLKVISGRGYLFEAEVSGLPTGLSVDGDGSAGIASGPEIAVSAGRRLPFGLRGTAAAVAGLCVVIGFAVAVILAPDFFFKREAPTVAVMPIIGYSDDSQAIAIANSVTEHLINGLAKIDNIRVVAPRSGAPAANPTPTPSSTQSDFVLQGELQKGPQSWVLQARVIEAATGEVQSVATALVDVNEPDVQLLQSRLAAGVGDTLTRRLNVLLEAGTTAGGNAKVVIEQAMASINQTSRERFLASQTMLENALAGEPDNIDLQVALAALQTRGIQMVWYGPIENAAAESNARSLLESALQARPRYIPVLEAYCRFLSATNHFIDSLVACAEVLDFAPWNGSALYQLGLTQIQLGRFEDALATFKQADRFDTPVVSRWTWLLGIGWANLLLGHNEEAVRWLERSIAITPASGRPYMLLASAYQRLGRPGEASAAMAKALELRPGSTALNVASPTDNVSPIFLEASKQLQQTMIEAGLPER